MKIKRQLYIFFIRKWKIKITVLLLSLSLWAYKKSTLISYVKINIPIVYLKKPSNLYFTDNKKRFVKVEIKGEKSNLKFPTQNLKVIVNLKRASKKRKRYNIYFAKNQLPDKVDIVSIPKQIEVKLESAVSKRVPIKINIQGKSAKGYKIDSIFSKPEFIKIEGSTSSVKDISRIFTKKLYIQNRRTSFKKRILLKIPKGVKILGNKKIVVSVNIYPINTITEKTFNKIKIIPRNLDPALNTFMSEQFISVRIKSTKNIIAKISKFDIRAYVDLDGTHYNRKTNRVLPFETEPGIKIQLKLLKYKNRIKILNIVPEILSVRFKVKKEFKTK